MPRYKVIVSRLNQRKFPVENMADNSNVVGEVFKDFEFDGELALTNKLGDWYKDTTTNFYWGGGIKEIHDKKYQQWMLNLHMPEIWKISTGKGVGIAIIDTGINTQNAELVFNRKDFFIFDKTFSIQDTQGHGTHCAGLISARNNTDDIIGTAPGCSLYICKIAEGGSLEEAETIRYAEAINWCANNKDVHVISISWASFINDESILDQIQSAIDNATAAKKVVVCAMGDATRLNDPGPLYPAALNNTIGVGSIPVKDILYPYINKSLVTSLEGLNIPSYGLDGDIIEMTGTSQSNAIIAGIIALIIEKEKFSFTPLKIKDMLTNLSTSQIFEGVQLPVINSSLLLNYFSSQ